MSWAPRPPKHPPPAHLLPEAVKNQKKEMEAKKRRAEEMALAVSSPVEEAVWSEEMALAVWEELQAEEEARARAEVEAKALRRRKAIGGSRV